MLFSELRKDLSLTLLRDSFDLRADELTGPMQQLGRRGASFLNEVGLSQDAASFRWRADMRYRGQEHSVDVPMPPPPLDADALAGSLATFHALHQRRYGHAHPAEVIELVTLRLSVLGPVDTPQAAPTPLQPDRPDGARRVHWRGREQTMPILQRSNLTPDTAQHGPCIVEEPTATTFVPEGWRLQLDGASASLILRRVVGGRS
jgi:N-methylhydantoinase A